MIRPGPLLGPVKTKMAQRHWLLETWASLKSSGVIDHIWPQKELTVVERAMKKQYSVNK
jgi:hypothetical protein